jgi:carbonic anhydrase
MVNLETRRARFVDGLIEGAGWDRASAELHFAQFAPEFEIGDEVTFALAETGRLSHLYPRIQVIPLLYKVEDSRLYLIQD